ncbi:hypothetical protein ACFW04_012686 [Cataglyphis niger]
MDTTEVTDKSGSWNQIVDSENLITKNKECPSKTEMLADILAKGKLTSLSMSKFTKSINKLNKAKLKVEPNLSTAMKRRTKIDLCSNIKKKEVIDESLENKIRQLTVENQKLKLLLEEADRKNKEIRQGQVMQSAGQGTLDISTKNRFEVLEEESLSATQGMEAEMGEAEERSFVQILKDKNNRRTINNKSTAQLYTNKHAEFKHTHKYSNLMKDSNNNFIIQEVEQKLDVLGSHFALINDQNSKMGKSRLNEIIIKETARIKKEIETDKEKNFTICKNQFGFRAKHSTIHAINKLTSDINWALMNEDCLGACLVDLEKAFDTVWQEGLIFKLKKKNFPINRSFVISHFNTLSKKQFTIINGLQQGTINSPILFNIYTADLLRFFGPDNTKCSLIAYADDLIIYCAGREPETIKKNIQLAVNKIFDFYNTWKLKVNTDKCETILFRPSLKRARYPISRQYKNFVLKDENTGNKLIRHKK